MIIDKLLAGGVKIWLRSQLSEITRLQVNIDGKDQQIMTGYIPDLFIMAEAATYQDISLSQVEVRGLNIRFNLPEILRRKPFQLLEPISVITKVLLKESDLQTSLTSTLLRDGLNDFWHHLLQETTQNFREKFDGSSIIWQDFSLKSETLILTGNLKDRDSQIKIITNLTLLNPQTLLFSPITILGVPELVAKNIAKLAIDLGNDITISELKLGNNQLLIRGEITVFPT